MDARGLGRSIFANILVALLLILVLSGCASKPAEANASVEPVVVVQD